MADGQRWRSQRTPHLDGDERSLSGPESALPRNLSEHREHPEENHNPKDRKEHDGPPSFNLRLLAKIVASRPLSAGGAILLDTRHGLPRYVVPRPWSPSSSWPRTPAFHAGNRGSNPRGDVSKDHR